MEIPKEGNGTAVHTVTIGSGESAIEIGGSSTMPFVKFDGSFGNRPAVFIEASLEGFGADDTDSYVALETDKISDIDYDGILIRLPEMPQENFKEAIKGPSDAFAKFISGCTKPLIVAMGSMGDADYELLRVCAEIASNKRVVLYKAETDDYKRICGIALAYDHCVAGQTSIDVNLAKQLNILIGQLGISSDRILTDPLTGALGYGLEYTYSVIERVRLAALQKDDGLRSPVMCDATVAWDAREVKRDDGDKEWQERGKNWEMATASAVLLAGADLVVLRHPDNVKRAKKLIDSLNGGR